MARIKPTERQKRPVLGEYGLEEVQGDFPIRVITPDTYKRRDSGVYIIRVAGYYKIGCTSNLTQRLSIYRTTNPLPIELVLFLCSGFSEQMEKEIHALMNHKRAFGDRREWFQLEKEDIVTIWNYLEKTWKELLTQQNAKEAQ